jgi:hypothetical protein
MTHWIPSHSAPLGPPTWSGSTARCDNDLGSAGMTKKTCLPLLLLGPSKSSVPW